MTSHPSLKPAIEVRDLTKRWSADACLLPVTFAVDAGQCVVVRGRSGSGKSTLLAILAGWCPPDGGIAEVNGRRAAANPTWAEVAVVPQVLALAPELTVRENIADAGTAGDRDIIDEVIRALGLDGVAGRPPAQI